MGSARTLYGRRKGRPLLPLIALLLFAMTAHGQTLDPMPAFLRDVTGQFPLRSEFSFEQQIQTGAQGNSTTGNPFAYTAAL